ncbi:MAG TPA: metal-dependent hydrolase [Candidatus Acidoferrum sp.]
MDTITHGIAGALIAKAAFRGQDMLGARGVNRQIITWSLMLGAIFPDSDVFREFFSNNDLLILTWHRSITHSLVCLPIFAVALALLTRWFVRWRKWESPSFGVLLAVYAAGILSHILLDLVTSFGTMIWSPVKWSRPAWDLIFIIDFTLTAILLVPQFVAWVYRKPEGLQRRALGSWMVFSVAALAVAAFALFVGAPISMRAIFAAVVMLAAAFLLPAVRNWGLRIRLASWNLAGLLLSLGYIGAAVYAHRVALERVDKFSSSLHLEVQSQGALPFPPSLWHWDGLVLTPRGVYELRMNLSGESTEVQAAAAGPDVDPSLTYRFYPDAAPNPYIEAAKRLPEVRTVLWFARFPVTRFHKEGADAIVEISDLRFPQMKPDRPASFTYRVRFAPDGTVVSQGWIKPK